MKLKLEEMQNVSGNSGNLNTDEQCSATWQLLVGHVAPPHNTPPLLKLNFDVSVLSEVRTMQSIYAILSETTFRTQWCSQNFQRRSFYADIQISTATGRSNYPKASKLNKKSFQPKINVPDPLKISKSAIEASLTPKPDKIYLNQFRIPKTQNIPRGSKNCEEPISTISLPIRNC